MNVSSERARQADPVSAFPITEGAGHQDAAAGRTFPLYRAYRVDVSAASSTGGQSHHLTNLLDQIDAETKQQMVVQHLRIVVSIAKHYTNRGLDLIELVRVGNQGLLHALERFEPEGGFCFSTFLTWCVSRQIELAILKRNRDGGAGRVPGVSGGDAMRSVPLDCGRLT